MRENLQNGLMALRRKLGPMKAFSLQWLKNALDKRKLPTSVRELQLWKAIEHDRRLHALEQALQSLRTIPALAELLSSEQPKTQGVAEKPSGTSSAVGAMFDAFLRELLQKQS